MKKIILISAILFSFNGWALSNDRPSDETAAAHQDIADALQVANESDKYILLALGGNWCTARRTLDA